MSNDEKRPAKPEKKAAKPGKKNVLVRFVKYMKEVVGELKKLTWPTPKELISYTLTVVAFIALVAIVIGILDYVFGEGLALVGSL